MSVEQTTIQADIGRFLDALARTLAERKVAHMDARRKRVAGYGKLIESDRADWNKALYDDVADPSEFKSALQRAIDYRRCAVIHADVGPIKHMWAPVSFTSRRCTRNRRDRGTTAIRSDP